MSSEWTSFTVAELESKKSLLVQDGNHGAHRPRKEEKVSSGIPHVRAADIGDNGSIDFASAEQLADSAWQRIKKGRARGGDVLFTHKGTVGRVAKAPEDAARFLCSPQTTFWRSLRRDVVDQGYLYCFLRSPRFMGQIRGLMHESDMAPYVSLTNQRGLLVDLPPISEQRAIASVLGALDDKIESNRRYWQKQHDLLPALYEASVRQPAEGGTIGDLGTIVGGGTPKSSEPSYWEPAQVAWITPKDMTALGGAPVVRGGVRGVSRTGLASSSAKLLPKGSVVYTSRATLGLIAITQRELATNQGFICVVPDPRLGSAFVYCSLSALRDQIHAVASGSTFMEVNKTNFRSVACPRPTEEALLGFRESAEALLDNIASLLDESRTLTALRDALLPRLVSGRIRVPLSADPEEQFDAAVKDLGG